MSDIYYPLSQNTLLSSKRFRQIFQYMIPTQWTVQDFSLEIIDKNTFALAAQELHKRADKLGRTNKIPKVSTKYAPTHFSIKKADDSFPDPFKQAEYIYSLIESEVL